MSVLFKFIVRISLGLFFVSTATASLKPNYSIQYQNDVKSLIRKINSQNIWEDLKILTSYPDRHANSTYKINGLTVDQFIKHKVELIAKNSGRKDVDIYTVATGKYKQNSVVYKLGNATTPGIVIGAHMDTTRAKGKELKPGADDDGSGTAAILELARVLTESGWAFKNPIYFIWYAAEEEGYIGSQYVVKDFQNKKIAVSSVMQFDQIGYAPNGNGLINLITNRTHPKLTDFVETLIRSYLKKDIWRDTCYGACSDYLSWHEAGFPAVFPFEIDENPVTHTSEDTMDKLSIDHMVDFTQLGVAYLVELAEPVKAG